MQEERTRERFNHMTLLLNLSLVFNAVIIKHSNILDIKELYLSVQGVISSVTKFFRRFSRFKYKPNIWNTLFLWLLTWIITCCFHLFWPCRYSGVFSGKVWLKMAVPEYVWIILAIATGNKGHIIWTQNLVFQNLVGNVVELRKFNVASLWKMSNI